MAAVLPKPVLKLAIFPSNLRPIYKYSAVDPLFYWHINIYHFLYWTLNLIIDLSATGYTSRIGTVKKNIWVYPKTTRRLDLKLRAGFLQFGGWTRGEFVWRRTTFPKDKAFKLAHSNGKLLWRFVVLAMAEIRTVFRTGKHIGLDTSYWKTDARENILIRSLLCVPDTSRGVCI